MIRHYVSTSIRIEERIGSIQRGVTAPNNLIPAPSSVIQQSTLFAVKALVQLLRILHTNQQPHMIFAYLAKIVEQNERNPTL